MIRSRARQASYPLLLPTSSLLSFQIQNAVTDENLEHWSTKLRAYCDSDTFIVKVARSTGRVAGWYLARNDVNVVHLMSMFVNPNEQGKGTGKALLLDLIDESGQKDITLAVLETNESAIKFYEKQGFKEVKKLKDTYLGAKRILMERAASIA